METAGTPRRAAPLAASGMGCHVVVNYTSLVVVLENVMGRFNCGTDPGRRGEGGGSCLPNDAFFVVEFLSFIHLAICL